MDKLWRKSGLDLQMSPYGCISTGDGVGMIEVVLNAETTASISKKAGGATAAFYVGNVSKIIKQNHIKQGINDKDEQQKQNETKQNKKRNTVCNTDVFHLEIKKEKQTSGK